MMDTNLEPQLPGTLTDRSGFDTARQEQLEDERIYHALFEHMLNGFAYCRMLFEGDQAQDFIYLRVNKAFAVQTGLVDVTGRRVSEVIPGIRESDPALLELYGRVARGGRPERFETFVKALGQWFAIEVYCPKPEHFVVIFDVITERKQSEDRLRMQSLVLDQIQDHVTITDLCGVVTYVNRVEAGTLNLAGGSIVGQHVAVYGDDPRADATRQEIVDATLSRGAWRGNVVNRESDGSSSLIELRTSLIRDERGQPVALVGVGSNITQRHAAEEALRASEERYAKAFHTSLDAVNINRVADGMYIDVNQAFLDIMGYQRDEVIGRTSSELNIWEDPRDRLELVEILRRDGACRNHEFSFRSKCGQRVWGLMSAAVLDFDGVPCILSVTRDITERKEAEERIRYLAHFDTLTGLPNRAQLDDHGSFALSLARRTHSAVAVMFFDLDNFKDINDTLGHSAGDALLCELAVRLRAVLRENDTVSRLGGDEFIFLLHGVDANAAAVVAQKVLDAVAVPFLIDDYDLNVTGSIGIALCPDDGDNLETLIKSADAAMYRVKREGRNGYCFFTAEMQARSARHLQLVNALRQAQKREQLQLYFQPQIAVGDGRIVGAEALLRWTHPELGPVSPGEFIPAAEDSGLILPIGEWVIRNAARQASAWIAAGLAPLVMSVNLSAIQFRHPDLPKLVSRILEEENLPAAYFELELTEGAAMNDPQNAIAVMTSLHERGVRMSIDDFGTGYSSLNQLKKFKVYKLKIDQSFVRDISTNPEDKAIVSAIINMARSMGLKTLAEGVETAGQLAFLREQGCDEIQGYFYCRPLPADEFEAYARSLN